MDTVVSNEHKAELKHFLKTVRPQPHYGLRPLVTTLQPKAGDLLATKAKRKAGKQWSPIAWRPPGHQISHKEIAGCRNLN